MTELTPLQQDVLDAFKEFSLKEQFYWTGGTLLSVVYLHHRCSEDLDFFSDEPFSHDALIKFVQTLKEKTELESVEEKKIFDRWEFFLHNQKDVRLEFVRSQSRQFLDRELE